MIEQTGDGGVVEMPKGVAAPEPKLTRKNVFGRILSAIVAKKPGDLHQAKIERDIQQMQFNLRVMSYYVVTKLGGTYKAKQTLGPLTDDEIAQRSDASVTLMSTLMFTIQAAEEIIVRNGLLGEYQSQCQRLQARLQGGYPSPSEDELRKMRSMLESMMIKGAGNGKGLADAEDGGLGGVQLSDAGAEGEHPVDQEGVRGDKPGTALG